MPSRLFVVLPCFNEAAGIRIFFEDLKKYLLEIEKKFLMQPIVVLVDDGSIDNTWEQLEGLSFSGHSVISLRFSRNFGHQMAIFAGLTYVHSNYEVTSEDSVVIMDSDGQHPAHYIEEMIYWRMNGFHHVQMLRSTTEGTSWLKKVTSALFYAIFKKICGIDLPSGAADFRAISGQMLKNYIAIGESNRFNRGLFYWLGYKTKFISYKAVERKYGTSSYGISRMFKLAFGGITYFSSAPLTIFLAIFSGAGIFLSMLYFSLEIIRWFGGQTFQPGWFTILAFISFWSGIICLGQLITGIYLSRIFDETKKRPSFVIQDQCVSEEGIS